MAKKDIVINESIVQSFDYFKYSEIGLEDAPLPVVKEFRIIQPGNPALMDQKSKIFGVEPGKFYSYFADELVKEVEIIPCYVRQLWIIYSGYKNENPSYLYSDVNRPSGFIYDVDKGLHNGEGRSARKNIIVLGIQVKGVQVIEPIILRFSGASVKVAMKWLGVLNAPIDVTGGGARYIPPAFARIFTLSTELESNEGLAWFIYKLHEQFTWIDPINDLFKFALDMTTQMSRYYSKVLLDSIKQDSFNDVNDGIPF